MLRSAALEINVSRNPSGCNRAWRFHLLWTRYWNPQRLPERTCLIIWLLALDKRECLQLQGMAQMARRWAPPAADP